MCESESIKIIKRSDRNELGWHDSHVELRRGTHDEAAMGLPTVPPRCVF